MNGLAPDIPIRDIHLPDSISWWPPAPGWWVLGAFLVLLVLFAVVVLRYRRRIWLRKAALRELEQIVLIYRQQLNARDLLKNLSTLLRRLCLSRYPREKVAGLTGQDWLNFLEQGLPASVAQRDPQLSFTQGVGQLLLTVPYQRSAHIQNQDLEALWRLSKNWIEAISLAGLKNQLQAQATTEKKV